MKQFGVVVFGLAMTIWFGSPAFAQDSPKTGLVLGSGSTIGVEIPLGDSAGVRAGVGFSRSKTEFDGGTPADGISTAWHPSVDVLFYVKSWDATRLYVSPQYTLSRGTAKQGSNSATSHAHNAAFMVGATHTLGRFGVFAEAGLGYAWADNTTSKNSTWSTRSSIGGLIFF